MADEDRRERARKRVKALREFYIHLATYVVVMIVLFIVDYSDRGNWWVYWPAMGWGIAVVLQGVQVLKLGDGSKWEERKIRQYLEKEDAEDSRDR